MNETQRQRIRDAIATAADRLEEPALKRPGLGPTAGDLYVFPTSVDVSVEWLVVREHPDDACTILVAPADDTPLIGACDVPVSEILGRPLIVRCAQAGWISALTCLNHRRVGYVPDVVPEVRRIIAGLARGNVPTDTPADSDPEYMVLMDDLAAARESLPRE